jgi:hypothetical protein
VRSTTPTAGTGGQVGPSSLCGSDMSAQREATFLRPSEAAEITEGDLPRDRARRPARRAALLAPADPARGLRRVGRALRGACARARAEDVPACTSAGRRQLPVASRLSRRDP